MGSRLHQRRHANTAIIVGAGIAFALLFTSCGGGGGPVTPPPAPKAGLAISSTGDGFGNQDVGTTRSSGAAPAEDFARGRPLRPSGNSAINLPVVSPAGNLPSPVGNAAGLISITVTPAYPPIAAGNTQQFTATGLYQDGSTENLTASVAWNSSAPGVATINAAGLASGLAPGGAAITATFATAIPLGPAPEVTPGTPIVNSPPPSPISGSTTMTVTGAGPSVSLIPSALSFGGQTVGTSSAGQTVTLNNPGNATLSISSISLTGTNAGDFALTGTCGTTLVVSSSCPITVTFSPAAPGARTAGVALSDNAAGNPQMLSLSGTGMAPSIAATAGTPQSATINTAFAAPLVARVTGTGNNPVPGVSVTFTAPGTGAGGTFAGGSATYTTTANSSGVATATAFTANSTAGGPYYVVASATGLTSTNFALTNSPGAAVTVMVTSGTPQSATIDMPFGTAMQVMVTDSFGNLVPGVSVTFAAPAGPEASGTFAGGSTTYTTTTNSSGVATATAFTANATAGGPYTVTATASGVATPANFALTNTVGAAASIAATAGSLQSATISTAFGTALQATVKDSGGNLVPGVSVTFTAPGTGASGTFAGGSLTYTTTTNSSGVATATTFTANSTAGGPYNVVASATGASSANFALTNTPGPAASITATAGHATERDDQHAVWDGVTSHGEGQRWQPGTERERDVYGAGYGSQRHVRGRLGSLTPPPRTPREWRRRRRSRRTRRRADLTTWWRAPRVRARRTLR